MTVISASAQMKILEIIYEHNPTIAELNALSPFTTTHTGRIVKLLFLNGMIESDGTKLSLKNNNLIFGCQFCDESKSLTI